jgi:hypothetical protein
MEAIKYRITRKEDNEQEKLLGFESFCVSVCPRGQAALRSYETVIYCDTSGFYNIEKAGVYRVYSADCDKPFQSWRKNRDSVVCLWPFTTPFNHVRVWPAKTTRLMKDSTGEVILVFTNNKGVTTGTSVMSNVCDIILPTKPRSRPHLVQQDDEVTF